MTQVDVAELSRRLAVVEAQLGQALGELARIQSAGTDRGSEQHRIGERVAALEAQSKMMRDSISVMQSKLDDVRSSSGRSAAASITSATSILAALVYLFSTGQLP